MSNSIHDHDEKVGHFALGHLARVLAEAEYAIEHIGDLTALNLGDLRHSIGAAAEAARTAFGAAALLHNGAKLAGPWNGSSPTKPTPKAVFARHRQAVEEGADRVRAPGAPMLFRPPMLTADDVARPAAPQCTATTKAGNQCLNRKVRLPAGGVGQACETHLPPQARAEYKNQRDITISDYNSQRHDFAVRIVHEMWRREYHQIQDVQKRRETASHTNASTPTTQSGSPDNPPDTP